MQRRLAQAGVSWAARVVGRLARHLRGRGYSGFQVWRYLSGLAGALLVERPLNEQVWLDDLTQRLAAQLARRGRLAGLDARLRELIIDRRGAPDAGLAVSPFRGMAERALDGVPVGFVDDLRLYHRVLLDEADYRRANREHVRSPRTHHHIVRRLAAWAHWMHQQGFVSWQQLTAERFRQRLLQLGRTAKPGVVDGMLLELRAFFRELVSHRRLFRDPLTRVARPRTPDLMSRPVHVESLRRWFAVLTDDSTPAVRRLVGLLVVLHGLTPIEIAALTRRDVDLRRRSLRLRRRRIVIDLDPITTAAVLAYLAARPACSNAHLLVTTRSKLAGTAASNSFVSLHLRALEIPSRATRQHLIRTFATEQGRLLAAKYFRISTRQIGRHMLHQEVLFAVSNQ